MSKHVTRRYRRNTYHAHKRKTRVPMRKYCNLRRMARYRDPRRTRYGLR